MSAKVTGYPEMDEWYGLFYSCPACENRNIMKGSKYCSFCGIHLDWSEAPKDERYTYDLQ